MYIPTVNPFISPLFTTDHRYIMDVPFLTEMSRRRPPVEGFIFTTKLFVNDCKSLKDVRV